MPRGPAGVVEELLYFFGGLMRALSIGDLPQKKKHKISMTPKGDSIRSMSSR